MKMLESKLCYMESHKNMFPLKNYIYDGDNGDDNKLMYINKSECINKRIFSSLILSIRSRWKQNIIRNRKCCLVMNIVL